MTAELSTPLTHKLIESPLGRLFQTRLFERLKVASVGREFGVLRARAAADEAGTDVDAFLDILGAPTTVDPSLLSKIETALEQHAEAKAAHERVAAEWNALFWDGEDSTPEERIELEQARRETGGAWVSPQKTFKFLAKRDFLDIVDFEIPAPAATIEEWGGRSGAEVFGPPETVPDIEVSATMRGPGTTEYLVRFETPATYVDDTAYARVYDPADWDGDTPLPTLIFGTGLAMACDTIAYWTEEAYVGRRLAPEGYRVILPIPPWHGRREIPGWYTGEPYLARMPVSAVELYEAQVKEIAVLTAWARDRGAKRVGVGGLSLGGIVATYVASYADTWPAAMRPDFAVPVAGSTDVGELLLDGSLTEILGVTGALETAGWSADDLASLDDVLKAPPTPGIDASSVYPVGGLVDEMTQYPTMRATLDEWGVPEENRLEWDCGHFGVTLRAMRTDEFQQFLIDALEAGVPARTDPVPA